ncbi:MAG: hypothetical protein U0640_09000 [Phycisphaerales bacterium]
MKPHPRIRKFFKWGGVVVSVLLLTVWVGSAFVYVLYQHNSCWALQLSWGQLVYNFVPVPTPPFKLMFKFGQISPPFLQLSLSYTTAMGGLLIWIPLWPFVAISIAITAAAWRMDTLAQRRKRLGGCPACGYDRAGLSAYAPCPECNAKA